MQDVLNVVSTHYVRGDTVQEALETFAKARTHKDSPNGYTINDNDGTWNVFAEGGYFKGYHILDFEVNIIASRFKTPSRSGWKLEVVESE